MKKIDFSVLCTKNIETDEQMYFKAGEIYNAQISLDFENIYATDENDNVMPIYMSSVDPNSFTVISAGDDFIQAMLDTYSSERFLNITMLDDVVDNLIHYAEQVGVYPNYNALVFDAARAALNGGQYEFRAIFTDANHNEHYVDYDFGGYDNRENKFLFQTRTDYQTTSENYMLSLDKDLIDSVDVSAGVVMETMRHNPDKSIKKSNIDLEI